jgi:hypothetical protein
MSSRFSDIAAVCCLGPLSACCLVVSVNAVVVTSRLQFTTTEGCPDTFDQIVYVCKI